MPTNWGHLHLGLFRVSLCDYHPNMAFASGHCYIEWKEQFVSKERGKRVVHYFLKDVSGESILAVIGTERSVRHMFYVVSEEFLNVHGSENSVHTGFRWRSRREVVYWLTSMLSKQHWQTDLSRSPKNGPTTEANGEQTHMPNYKGRLARNLKGQTSDIVWSGVAWTCGKQLKHYPAFCRNGIKIVVQSFAFVMAEEENHYLAYLEDMYEDRQGQKNVKVRWFHRNQEIKGVVSIRNPHPKEVFITPYAQVISVECVDGPAIVLTPEDYEKCLSVIPNALLARVHLCYRQFKSNRVKTFKLSKLLGYFDQPIFSCLDPDFIDDEEFSPRDGVKVGTKRTRSGRGRQMFTYEPSFQNLKYDLLSRRLISHKQVECELWHSRIFKVSEKIELLCQDSGIRGCWFRCTVVQVSHRQMRVQYDDVKDEEGCGNLEEWVPAFRLAMPDKLGMRCPGRQTIRPALPCDQVDLAFEIGAPVDAWWSDGWWEGVVTGFGDENLQVYIPSENLLLNTSRKNLRVSKDWMGDHWVDIEVNRDILSAISALVSSDTRVWISSSTVVKEPESCDVPMSCHEVPTTTKLDKVEEEKLEVDDLAPRDDISRDMDRVNHEKQMVVEDGDDSSHVNGSPGRNSSEYASNDNVEDNNDVGNVDDDGHKLEEFETDGPELLEVVA